MSEAEKVVENADHHPISQKKLEANRANAKFSTGPRTERGKRHSRRNSLKHGLFTSVLLVEGEDAGAFKKLVHDLMQEIEPVGRRECIDVEQLAVYAWNLRRVFQWENSIRQEPGLLDVEVSNIFHRTDIQRAPGMPSLPKLDLLRRYEASIQSHIRHVENHLEQLQRARKAKHISTPSSVQSGHD